MFKQSKTPKKSDGKKTINKNDYKDITNNIDIRQKITCQLCHEQPTTYVRVFDYRLLPTEFFQRPDQNILSLLHSRGITDEDAYPNYWVQLPKELSLTKYPFKICEICYCVEKNKPLNIWNQWIKQ